VRKAALRVSARRRTFFISLSEATPASFFPNVRRHALKIGRRHLLFLLGAFLEPYHALNLSVEHEGQDRATLWQALFDVELRRDACRGNDESTRD